MARLGGRIAVVTGSARGIGKQIAVALAGEGADVVCNDLRDDSLTRTMNEIERLGRKAVAVGADISTREGAYKLIGSAVERFGKVDILVNNAGINSRSRLVDLTVEEWDRVHGVDLKGPFLCSQAAARSMIQHKYGKIINISSSAGGFGDDQVNAAYSAAKAGLIAFTKACARELGPYVNSLAPGTVLTDLTHRGRTSEQVEERLRHATGAAMLRRTGTVQDIANVAVFLASDESSFITAQTIICDGGWMSHWA